MINVTAFSQMLRDAPEGSFSHITESPGSESQFSIKLFCLLYFKLTFLKEKKNTHGDQLYHKSLTMMSISSQTFFIKSKRVKQRGLSLKDFSINNYNQTIRFR